MENIYNYFSIDELGQVKTYLSDCVKIILDNTEKIINKVSEKQEKDKDEIDKLDNLIKTSNNDNDHKKLSELHQKAYNFIIEIEELNKILDELSVLNKELSKFKDNIPDKKIGEVVRLIQKNYNNLYQANLKVKNYGIAIEDNEINIIKSKLEDMKDKLVCVDQMLNKIDDMKNAVDVKISHLKEKTNDLKKKINESISNDDYTSLKELSEKMLEIKNEIERLEGLLKKLNKIEINLNTIKNSKDSLDLILEKISEYIEELCEISYSLSDDNEAEIERLADELLKSDDPKKAKVEELAKRYYILSHTKKNPKLEDMVVGAIYRYNALLQDTKIQEEVSSGAKKIGLNARINEFFGFSVNVVLRSKLCGRVLKNKIEKAEQSKDIDAVKKYKDINYQRDIISGVRLYKSLDSLTNLKKKLYKDGKLGRVLSIKYNKEAKNASKRLERGINSRLNKEEELILSDKQRTLNIAKQYMQMLSIYDVRETSSRLSKIKKVLRLKTDKEKFLQKVKDVRSFLNKAEESGALTQEEVLAYEEEIANIAFYKKLYSDCNSYNYTDSDVQEILKKDYESVPYIKK